MGRALRVVLVVIGGFLVLLSIWLSAPERFRSVSYRTGLSSSTTVMVGSGPSVVFLGLVGAVFLVAALVWWVLLLANARDLP